MSALWVVGLALNLRAYDFVSQKIRAAKNPEFKTFYTKNILFNMLKYYNYDINIKSCIWVECLICQKCLKTIEF